MKLWVSKTDSLGDLLNGFPTFKGIYDSYGKYDLILKSINRKFNGIKEFFLYQDIFNDVKFDDECDCYGAMKIYVPIPWDESTDVAIRPAETSRWNNGIKQLTGLEFNPDDHVVLKYPNFDIEFDDENYIIGDRWDGIGIDQRRARNILLNIKGNNIHFLNYNNSMLLNCYLIMKSKKPFIGTFTGSAVLSNLLNKKTLVVWKKEDWHPSFWNGENILWDGGKDIVQTFQRHFYTNRECVLVHWNNLKEAL